MKALHDRTPRQHYLEYARMIAEGHHERYDGKGYPSGLAGDAIPLCCRIMAVVNVYDACLTPRIYRPALSRWEARRLIVGGKGTEFDPSIVETFEEAYDEFAALDVSDMRSSLLQKKAEGSLRYEADTGSGR